jgi:glycerol 3-phosphatase-2
MAEGAQAVADGAVFVASNADTTIPSRSGPPRPGNGALLQVISSATGVKPIVAGKPERPLHRETILRTGAERPLIVGDRLDTDILGANRAGMPSALVLTGIDRPKHVLAAASDLQPTYLLSDLRELHEPYPEARVSDGVVTVRGASVRIDGPDVRILSEGDRPIDLLRAGAKAIWDTGRAIYGFRVPEQLYADPFHRP